MWSRAMRKSIFLLYSRKSISSSPCLYSRSIQQSPITANSSGAEFPVNPIDATFPVKDNNGNVECLGAFRYAKPNQGAGEIPFVHLYLYPFPSHMTFAFHLKFLIPILDFILGDSFLRNVYSLYDFGSWTSVVDSAPFMKLLSVRSHPFLPLRSSSPLFVRYVEY
jgi:hypothetical protein